MAKQNGKRRVFSAEFKLEAVRRMQVLVQRPCPMISVSFTLPTPFGHRD
jgi:transposase-like protein